MIKKTYADSRFGQIHVRIQAAENSSNAPLVLLHPMPYSSLYYTTVMPMLDSDRTVIAIDYPGCGGSDIVDGVPRIEDYAAATQDVLDYLGLQTPCHLLGFHTGCLVAAELSNTSPARVASCILIDIPLFDQATADKYSASLTSHRAYTQELSCLESLWKDDVKTRLEVTSLERAVAIFADHVAANGDGADGFRAAFSYSAAQAFKQFEQTCLIIATKSGLYKATLEAASMIKSGKLVERTDITRSVFEEGANAIASEVNDWLAKL